MARPSPITVLGSLAWLAASGGPARADGAFPDSLQIFAPPDRPHEILAATNFGLVESQDDGATWSWTCEQAVAPGAFLYQMGPSPGDHLYASSAHGLAVSDDQACAFTFAQGALANATVADSFPDASDPLHILALASQRMDGSLGTLSLFESKDGGGTFSGPLYRAPAAGGLNGVEIARSDARTYYLSVYEYAPATHPFIARSIDGGATWQTFDVQPSLGPAFAWLLAVDPVNAQRVLARVTSAGPDKVALSVDGGQTFQVTLTLDSGAISAFLRRADGTLLVGKKDGGGFLSHDGGGSFMPWPITLHLRGLAERDGALFALADNFTDHFAVGVSHDDGASWQKLLGFDGFCGGTGGNVALSTCPGIAQTCSIAWDSQRCVLCAPNFCQVSDGGTAPGGGGGCGCRIAGRSVWTGAGAALLLGAVMLGLRRRR